MVLRGMFTDLAWEKLPYAHKKHWDSLKTRYAISSNLFNSQKSLDDVARECIHICRQHLFSLHSYPWDYEVPAGWRSWIPNACLTAKKLEEKLTGALCDHLIVTFAYYFYLENLEHKTVSDYLKEVFCCKKLFPQVPNTPLTKDECREMKRDFIKAVYNKYKNYIKSTKKAAYLYQKMLKTSFENSEITRADFVAEDVMKNFDISECDLSSKENDCLGIDWLFKLSMACNWVNSPFAIKGERIAIEEEKTIGWNV